MNYRLCTINYMTFWHRVILTIGHIFLLMVYAIKCVKFVLLSKMQIEMMLILWIKKILM